PAQQAGIVSDSGLFRVADPRLSGRSPADRFLGSLAKNGGRQMGVPLGHRHRRMAKEGANLIERPALAPPPRDEARRAAMAEVVPPNLPPVVALLGDDLGGFEVVVEAVALALLSAVSEWGRPEEA